MKESYIRPFIFIVRTRYITKNTMVTVAYDLLKQLTANDVSQKAPQEYF